MKEMAAMTLIDDKPDTECWLCEKPRADEWSVYCEEHMDGGTFCLRPICMPGQCVCKEGSDDN